ncbi:Uncharacterized protein PCOAH_00008270 [Plasmodium coatneyi]|uniref:Uncharacterized protein n=1 Tax=Plasmodium coatneyi TaxID=208452 RepID=A0A1B1DVK9_9APIC|nr:Uncharacterized protein PCOAH_00008270 [Plasmodium coatneyi]ANQ06615.1 Uncharacterized protein PCOAH_00008270 [Plasmodium coatneyi]
MNLYLNVLHEIEAILQRCNGDVYQKVRKINEYIRKNYGEDQEEVVARKRSTGARKKRANSRRRDEKDTGVAKLTTKQTAKQVAKLTTRQTAKLATKQGENANSIKNYFKVVKRESPSPNPHNADTHAEDAKTETSSQMERKKNKSTIPLINTFFFYGNYNIIIIIYYIIHKVKLHNEEDIFWSDSHHGGSPNGGDKDFIIHSNKNVTHIMCPQLKDNDVKGLNELVNEIISYKLNSLHIFIVESFNSLNRQFRKMFMGKISKSKNIIFIHSSVCLNDISLANCLYVRIPKPDKLLFISHFLHLSEDKYNIDIYDKERRDYVENMISSCNYDIPLILTMLYFIKINNFPELKKVIKLIINTNVKKLVCIIHKCVISKSSLFLIRNILYSILYTYNFDMDNFLTLFCKQLISFHKDDDNYKKEIFSLFSEYSYYCSLHDNHICSLESLASKVILLEQKYITTLNRSYPASEDRDELSTSFQSELTSEQQPQECTYTSPTLPGEDSPAIAIAIENATPN